MHGGITEKEKRYAYYVNYNILYVDCFTTPDTIVLFPDNIAGESEKTGCTVLLVITGAEWTDGSFVLTYCCFRKIVRKFDSN